MKKLFCELCNSEFLLYKNTQKSGDIAELHWTFNGVLMCGRCARRLDRMIMDGSFQLSDVPTRRLVYGQVR